MSAQPHPDLSAFGAVTLIAPLNGGQRKPIWRAELDGQPMVAKSTRRSEDALRWLLPLQAAARASGFLVPAMIETPRGFAPNGWTLEPFVTGSPALPVQMHALHPAVRSMHRIVGAQPQRPGFASTRDLIAQAAGGDVDLAAMPADLVAQIRAAWGRMTGSEVAIHGDICTGNLLMTAQGPALVDWDAARRDLPIYDTGAVQTASPPQMRARLAWEIACSWVPKPARALALAANFAG